jgi:hypothetical protein
MREGIWRDGVTTGRFRPSPGRGPVVFHLPAGPGRDVALPDQASLALPARATLKRREHGRRVVEYWRVIISVDMPAVIVGAASLWSSVSPRRATGSG